MAMQNTPTPQKCKSQRQSRRKVGWHNKEGRRLWGNVIHCHSLQKARVQGSTLQAGHMVGKTTNAGTIPVKVRYRQMLGMAR